MISSNKHSQEGFSLIELMVAISLSFIIIAGVVQMLGSGKKATIIQDSIGDVGEAGRFALYYLSRDIRMAGFPKFIEDRGDQELDAVGGLQAIVPPLVTDDARGDTIGLMYAAQRDCAGNITANYTATQIMADGIGNFYTKNEYFISDDGNGLFSLACRTKDRNNVTIQTQPLVENVEALQFLYGIDDDLDGVADRYSKGENLGAAQFPLIVVVKVAVLVVSDEFAGGIDPPATHVLLDQLVADPGDGKRRKVFSTTVEIRNRTPAELEVN